MRVLCYNEAQAITRPQRQQQHGTFLTNYKQLNHTYTFKNIFKMYNCITLYHLIPILINNYRESKGLNVYNAIQLYILNIFLNVYV